jgi:hypothetical protein
MRVEVLYFDGCASYQAAKRILRRVLLSLRETSFHDLPQIEVRRTAGSTPRPPAW